MNPLQRILDCLVGGFLVLLPALLTYLMLRQLFDALMVLTAPVLDALPASAFPEEWTARLVAVMLLLGLCLGAGLSMHTALARRFGAWLERVLLRWFPPYAIVKTLSQSLGGRDVSTGLRPALLTTGEGVRAIAFVVEEHANGEITVFQPLAPTPGVGTLQLVAADRIEKLDVSMTAALGCILNWGVGMEALLSTRPSGKSGS